MLHLESKLTLCSLAGYKGFEGSLRLGMGKYRVELQKWVPDHAVWQSTLGLRALGRARRVYMLG